MKAAGVIVEYNPFHNGHLYHLTETKKLTGAEILIAVMSGNFLQRGEPALVSKWQRTKMALLGGADLVIELPYAFAVQKADLFASGAISILDALFTDTICFGSEEGSITPFLNTYQFMTEKTDQFNKYVEDVMKKGVSYPKATAMAFEALIKDETESLVDLSKPNNILGFQYVSSIFKQNSTIKPTTIQRTGAQYHDELILDDKIASATSIRKTLFDPSLSRSEVERVVPTTTYTALLEYEQETQLLHNWESYFPFLKYRLMTMTPSQLNTIYEAEEGLEYRLLDSINEAKTFSEFMTKIKTKRYTWTRLQRFCVHILTNTTKAEMEQAHSGIAPYLRLLGMTTQGRAYLRSVKHKLELPLVAAASKFNHPLFDLDIKAVRTYASALREPFRTNMLKEEFSTPPLQLDRTGLMN